MDLSNKIDNIEYSPIDYRYKRSLIKSKETPDENKGLEWTYLIFPFLTKKRWKYHTIIIIFPMPALLE